VAGGRVPGLTRFRIRDGRVTRYMRKDGLFDDYPSSVLPDNSGNFWISTSGGIYRVSRQELRDFADGQLRKVHTVLFGVVDGMKTSEASDPTQQPAGWRSRDGKLWFATRKGLVIIDPDHPEYNELVPPVVIEEVVADGENLPASARARTDWCWHRGKTRSNCITRR